MFEDSRTQLFVLSVTNGNALPAALPNNAGGFYKVSDGSIEEGALEDNVEYRFIHRNSKGVLNFSPIFTPQTIANKTGLAAVARVEQISYLGYNGTSGSMDAANSTYYGLKVILDHTFGMLNNSPLMFTIPFKSDASATQYEVANGLAVTGTATFKRQAYKPLKIEKINAGAQKNAMGTATASVVNGSKSVVFSEDMTVICADGEIVRFGTSGAGVAPCYKIVANDGGAGAARVYTLDQEYQGATNATFAAATLETVTEGNWGLKFTGISVTDANFDPIQDLPFVVRFTLDASDFTTATVSNLTKPLLGSGTYQLVAHDEVYSQFQGKTREVSRWPRTSYLQSAVAGDTYKIFSFEYFDSKYMSPTTGVRPVSKGRINIAVKTGFDEVTEFGTVLGV